MGCGHENDNPSLALGALIDAKATTIRYMIAGGGKIPVKLGIISDSHGRIIPLRQALIQLDQAGAEAIIHCGDVGSLDILDELADRRCWFVWGNMDDPRPSWQGHVEAIGLTWPNGDLELQLAGKRLAVFHGHEPGFRQASQAPRYDYLLYGHTHQRSDQHVGDMRVINPGALHRTPMKTVALLDLTDDSLQFLEIQSPNI